MSVQEKEFTIKKPYGDRERLFAPVDEGEGRTMQEFKDECDINTIMHKYTRDGLVDHVREHEGKYGDFTAVVDYHTAMNITVEAREMFMTLPADLRSEFDNDPGKFLDFANDPENEEKMREMGLLPHDAVSQPESELDPPPADPPANPAEPAPTPMPQDAG